MDWIRQIPVTSRLALLLGVALTGWVLFAPSGDTQPSDASNETTEVPGDTAAGVDNNTLRFEETYREMDDEPETAADRFGGPVLVFPDIAKMPDPELPAADTGCDPGIGNKTNWAEVRWEQWGQIPIPFGDVWPTNPVGQAPTCFPVLPHDPATAHWTAAIFAAQVVWIDAFAPELIPEVAADTAGREARIADHPFTVDPETRVDPASFDAGWFDTKAWFYWPKEESGELFDIVAIEVKEGDTAPQVVSVPVQWSSEQQRWTAVYPARGRFEIETVDGSEIEFMWQFQPVPAAEAGDL